MRIPPDSPDSPDARQMVCGRRWRSQLETKANRYERDIRVGSVPHKASLCADGAGEVSRNKEMIHSECDIRVVPVSHKLS